MDSVNYDPRHAAVPEDQTRRDGGSSLVISTSAAQLYTNFGQCRVGLLEFSNTPRSARATVALAATPPPYSS